MKPSTSLLVSLLAPAAVLASPVPSLQTEVNEILAYISELFPASVALDSAATLIEAADSALALLFGWSTTESDITDGSTCGDVVVVFARGTDEPGNVGALVGPPFFDALRDALPSGKTLSVQGVDDYGATVTGYLEGGDPTGSTRMAALVTQAISQCPSSSIVMAGYSQGCQLVHNAAADLGATTMASISSVVMFGDPDEGQTISGIDSSKVLTVCHSGDDICLDGDLILLAHLTYAEDAGTAATFVINNI
ncbi:putative cutinase [Xylariales sp. PMI_506]|nr:putative cutinase [Xylariales sp. PMI_506]